MGFWDVFFSVGSCWRVGGKPIDVVSNWATFTCDEV